VTEIGTFCLVLHTHLPWLAGHGAWPVGEEWLYQSWSQAYLRVVDTLRRLADEGRRDLLTLGVTPVLAAQLDDPGCLRRFHTWLGYWQLRAEGLAGRREAPLRRLAGEEFRAATAALDTFGSQWRHGGSDPLRRLADAGVVELLAGPATHPFLPLIDDRLVAFSLRTGLDDHARRFGSWGGGLWAPECAYRPGLEHHYAAAGVDHLVADGPTLLHVGRDPAAAWTLGDTGVVVLGRDLEVTYRVWSPRRGYPGGRWYRDFHTYDHESGCKPARVTSPGTPPDRKAPYDPAAAAAAVDADVDDFVTVVRRRLLRAADELGRPGLIVAAYDTELFGHWWHEGPLFLERLLRRLPEAGIRPATLRTARADHVAGRVDPEAGSWGRGKDFRIWTGETVRDVVADGRRAADWAVALVDDPPAVEAPFAARRPDLDAVATQALLALASDWAFMVSHDSAADYARGRSADHADRTERLAGLVRAGLPPAAVAADPAAEHPFPGLDARLL
jgi:1,4-alpha-glucan branching enzyme